MTPNKAHVRQQDQTDCGVACLKAALNHFDLPPTSFERLRELSGTSLTGTTMLGLLQAANEVGMEAEGFEADLPSLRACTDLCVLHIVKNEQLLHYVVYYGYDAKAGTYLIGDSASPDLEEWSEEKLLAVWRSKALLLLKKKVTPVTDAVIQTGQWEWIKGLVEEDTALLSIALVMGVVLAVLGLATAIFSQQLLDSILPDADRKRLFVGAGLLLMLLLARAGIQYLRTFRNTESFLLNLLSELKADMGILVLTHRLSTARRSDKIFVLSEGTTITNGNHEELLAHGDNLYALAWKDLFR